VTTMTQSMNLMKAGFVRHIGLSEVNARTRIAEAPARISCRAAASTSSSRGTQHGHATTPDRVVR
jgi:hypothetical protein